MKKILATLTLILVLSLSAPVQAFAAIAFDASSSAANQTGTTATITHVTTGSNPVMFVCVEAASTARFVSTITYNGTSLTFLDKQDDSGTNNRVTEMWYLKGPASGSHDVVVTYTTAPTDFYSVGVETYTGADQTTQPDVSGKNTSGAGNVTSMAKAVTTTVDNAWLVGCATNLSNGALNTADSGSFLRQGIFPRVVGGNELWVLDSNGSAGSAGSHSLGWSWTGNAQANIVVAGIKPAAAAAAMPIAGLVRAEWIF